MKLYVKIFLLILTPVFATLANAELIKNGDVITDTSTKLQWLSWEKTVGFDESYLNSKLNDPNSEYFGWEIAKETDLLGLVNGYFGISVQSTDFGEQRLDLFEESMVDSFVSIIGDTSVPYFSWIHDYEIQDGHSGFSWAYGKKDDGSWVSLIVSDNQNDYTKPTGESTVSDSQDRVSLREAFWWDSNGQTGGTPAEAIALVRKAVSVNEPNLTYVALLLSLLLIVRRKKRTI